MKEYKGKTLMAWLEEIAAMDEKALKQLDKITYLYPDGIDGVIPAGEYSSGEIWCRLTRKALMVDILHKFGKNIEGAEDQRLYDQGSDLMEDVFYKGTKYE
jgi:hypothetical protein